MKKASKACLADDSLFWNRIKKSSESLKYFNHFFLVKSKSKSAAGKTRNLTSNKCWSTCMVKSKLRAKIILQRQTELMICQNLKTILKVQSIFTWHWEGHIDLKPTTVTSFVHKNKVSTILPNCTGCLRNKTRWLLVTWLNAPTPSM